MNQAVANVFSKLVLADHPVRVKLLGDSITHGVGGTGWEQNGELIVGDFRRSPDSYCWAKLFKDYLEANYNCTVVNNACTGTTIEFILTHFDTLVEDTDEIVLCNIGTNNRHQYYVNAPMHTREEHMRAFYANILKLNARFQAAGKKVVFIANIPASAENEKDGPDYARLFHMSDVCDLYTKASAEAGFPLIRLYSLFLEDAKARKIDYTTLLADGLHPNDSGYDVMFRLIVQETGLSAPIR